MPGPDKHMPCKGCPDRTAGERETDCHTTCEAYKAYAAEVQKSRVFLMRMQEQRPFPGTMKYKKSSGCWVAPKVLNHKKVKQ